MSPAAQRVKAASPSEEETVTTVVRLRPRLEHERTKDGELEPSVLVEDGVVVLVDPFQNKETRSFECDVVLDSSDPSSPDFVDQQAVYSRVGKHLVERSLEGIDCCLCAYGQTGTGKTHTLSGDWSKSSQRGLLPRIAGGLLAGIERLRAEGGEVQLKASFVEIYNNRLNDLLSPADTTRTPAKKHPRLEIHTHPVLGVFIQHLTEIPVESMKEVGRCVAVGEKLRHTAQTSMNQRSSRSHTIFSFRLEVKTAGPGAVAGAGAGAGAAVSDASTAAGSLFAALQVVDLAGRENEQTSECTGERFRELTFINRSLFHLANCISALSDRKNREHVPFRNSKLTMLLSESFQRNSKTFLLATLTPSAIAYDENLLTCRFLESTGRITTQPVPNRWVSEAESVAAFREEVDSMRAELGQPSPSLSAEGGPTPGQAAPLSRQELLDRLAGVGGVQASPQQRRGRHLENGDEEAKEVAMLDACIFVQRRLAEAEKNLGALSARHASVGAALGGAERRLDVAAAAMKDLYPEFRLAPRRAKTVEAADATKVAEGRPSDPGIGRVVTLPPLLPMGKLPRQGGGPVSTPLVTFSVELPPIVLL